MGQLLKERICSSEKWCLLLEFAPPRGANSKSRHHFRKLLTGIHAVHLIFFLEKKQGHLLKWGCLLGLIQYLKNLDSFTDCVSCDYSKD